MSVGRSVGPGRAIERTAWCGGHKTKRVVTTSSKNFIAIHRNSELPMIPKNVPPNISVVILGKVLLPHVTTLHVGQLYKKPTRLHEACPITEAVRYLVRSIHVLSGQLIMSCRVKNGPQIIEVHLDRSGNDMHSALFSDRLSRLPQGP